MQSHIKSLIPNGWKHTGKSKSEMFKKATAGSWNNWAGAEVNYLFFILSRGIN